MKGTIFRLQCSVLPIPREPSGPFTLVATFGAVVRFPSNPIANLNLVFRTSTCEKIHLAHNLDLAVTAVVASQKQKQKSG